MKKLSELRYVFAGPLFIAAALALAACGGGDDEGPAPNAGPMVCDRLGTDSHRYTLTMVQQVQALVGTPPPSVLPQVAYTFTTEVEAEIERGVEVSASVHTTDGANVGDTRVIRFEDNTGYFDAGTGLGWELANNPDRPVNVPVSPFDICRALAPDIDTSLLGPGESENVNGIRSHKYTIEAMESLMFSRDPNYAGGNLSRYARTLGGAVWVADDGNFLTKANIVLTGVFPSGQGISGHVVLEIDDLGDDIKVEPPDLPG